MILPVIDVSRETEAKLAEYAALVREEAARQNLVAASTIADFTRRHIADSAQLFPLLRTGHLVDIGSGAGLPGIVLAILGCDKVSLVEPRSKRAAFLRGAVEALGIQDRVEIVAGRVEMWSGRGAASITARAVAKLDRLFDIAEPLATPATRWVLPKGRSAAEELAQARRSWHGEFRLVPSLTDPDAAIVVAEGVRRRSR